MQNPKIDCPEEFSWTFLHNRVNDFCVGMIKYHKQREKSYKWIKIRVKFKKMHNYPCNNMATGIILWSIISIDDHFVKLHSLFTVSFNSVKSISKLWKAGRLLEIICSFFSYCILEMLLRKTAIKNDLWLCNPKYEGPLWW